jgi:hypothetical protein
LRNLVTGIIINENVFHKKKIDRKSKATKAGRDEYFK